MADKEGVVSELTEMLDRWQGFLAGLSEEQATARGLPADLSIKDVVGHLRAWQQVSTARLEAAMEDRTPVLAGWPERLDVLDEEGDVDPTNASVHDTYRNLPWAQVHEMWSSGFHRFLELAEAIPESVLMEEGRYRWLSGHPLRLVLEGSLEHHQEHLEEVETHLHSL